MKLITPDAMRAAEQAYFERVSSLDVMDRAAFAVAQTVQAQYRQGRIAVLVGPGNNGGDGYGCAAHLLRMGRQVSVFVLGTPRGDALREREILQSLGGSMQPLEALDLNGISLVVDALLGIGFSRPPQGEMARAIRSVRESGLPVVSVDVPTGADAMTGAVPGEAMRADHTVTFSFAKPGHFLYPARALTGELHIAPLGLEDSVGDGSFLTLTEAEAASLLADRPLTAHKGTFGSVLCVAGSLGMTGAGSLASEATLRAGCGKTTWLYPGNCPVQPAREVMAMPLGEKHFTLKDLDAVLEFASRCDVAALGPGLGREPQTLRFVRRAVKGLDKPFVLDADGLMAFTARADGICGGGRGILTPHVGEAAALLNETAAQIIADPVAAVTRIARQSGCIAVLKGASTLISDGERVCINATGNPGMATAGSGDVLTGIIAGLLAQGTQPFEAACLGVYVHGLAGDIAARSGERGMIAGDILACVPGALQRLDDLRR